MKENKLRYHLNQGLPLISTRMWSTQPVFYEALGQTGNFDYVEFVAENAPFDFSDLPNIARACELHEMGSMIKVDFQNRGYVAQKAVQGGFQSIMFVDHETAAQVQESVNLIRPKTAGSTGDFGFPNARYIGNQAYLPALDHAKRLNDIVLCFMIEKEKAMENIEEICKVPGVDMIQFGANDYCMSRGFNKSGQAAEEAKAAERHCIEVALANGIRPRCEIMKPQDAKYYADLGVKDFSLGDQMVKLRNFWNTEGKEMRTLVESFQIG